MSGTVGAKVEGPTKTVDLVLQLNLADFVAARKAGRKALLPAFPRGEPRMNDDRRFAADDGDFAYVITRFSEAQSPRPVVYDHALGPRGGMAAGKLIAPVVDAWGLSFEADLTARATEEVEAGEWFGTSVRFLAQEDAQGRLRPGEIIHITLTNDPAIDGMPAPYLFCREVKPDPATPPPPGGDSTKPASRPGEESMEVPTVPAPTPVPAPAAPATVDTSAQIDALVDRRVAEKLAAAETRSRVVDFVNRAVLSGKLPEASRTAAEGMTIEQLSATLGDVPVVPTSRAVDLSGFDAPAAPSGPSGLKATDQEVAKIAQFASRNGIDLPTAWRQMKAANLTRLEA